MRRGKREKVIEQPNADPVEIRYTTTKGIPIEMPVPERELVEVPVRKEEKEKKI